MLRKDILSSFPFLPLNSQFTEKIKKKSLLFIHLFFHVISISYVLGTILEARTAEECPTLKELMMWQSEKEIFGDSAAMCMQLAIIIAIPVVRTVLWGLEGSSYLLDWRKREGEAESKKPHWGQSLPQFQG